MTKTKQCKDNASQERGPERFGRVYGCLTYIKWILWVFHPCVCDMGAPGWRYLKRFRHACSIFVLAITASRALIAMNRLPFGPPETGNLQ